MDGGFVNQHGVNPRMVSEWVKVRRSTEEVNLLTTRHSLGAVYVCQTYLFGIEYLYVLWPQRGAMSDMRRGKWRPGCSHILYMETVNCLRPFHHNHVPRTHLAQSRGISNCAFIGMSPTWCGNSAHKEQLNPFRTYSRQWKKRAVDVNAWECAGVSV